MVYHDSYNYFIFIHHLLQSDNQHLSKKSYSRAKISINYCVISQKINKMPSKMFNKLGNYHLNYIFFHKIKTVLPVIRFMLINNSNSYCYNNLISYLFKFQTRFQILKIETSKCNLCMREQR